MRCNCFDAEAAGGAEVAEEKNNMFFGFAFWLFSATSALLRPLR